MSEGRPCRLCRFQFRQLPLHLDNQRRQLLLALLTGMGVDVAGVFFAVDLLGRVAALPQVVIDLADAARPRSAVRGTVRRKLHRRNGFLLFHFALFLYLHPGDALVNISSRWIFRKT